MKLATVRIEGRTRAVRVEGDTLVDLGALDLGELLARDGWQEIAASASGPTYAASVRSGARPSRSHGARSSDSSTGRRTIR